MFNLEFEFLRHISSFRSYSSRHGRTLNRVEILTLDPNKFAEKKQRRLNIGGKLSVKPRVSLHKQSSFFKSPRLSYGTLMSNKPAYYPLEAKPFFITPLHQENLASRENYGSELHQLMILRLSKVGQTSC